MLLFEKGNKKCAFYKVKAGEISSSQNPWSCAPVKCSGRLVVGHGKCSTSSTPPLFGISPTIEIGDGCHREVTLTLPLVFILSKAPLDWKMVVESAGRANGHHGQYDQDAMVLQA